MSDGRMTPTDRLSTAEAGCRPAKVVMVDAMRRRVAAVLVLLIGGYLGFNYFIRPIPAVGAVASIPASTTVDGSAPAMPWPSAGSAAIGVSGLGLIESSGR